MLEMVFKQLRADTINYIHYIKIRANKIYLEKEIVYVIKKRKKRRSSRDVKTKKDYEDN